MSTKTGFRRRYEDSLYETLEALDAQVAVNEDLVAKNRALRATVGFCAGVLMGATAKFEEESRGIRDLEVTKWRTGTNRPRR